MLALEQICQGYPVQTVPGILGVLSVVPGLAANANRIMVCVRHGGESEVGIVASSAVFIKKKNCGKVYITYQGFPGSSIGKESACSAGDTGFIPGLGRSTGEGNGKPLQYPCLKNPMDRGALWAVDHGIAESQAQLSN